LGCALPFTLEKMAQWLAEGLVESGFSEALVRVSLHGLLNRGGGEAVAIFREFDGHPARWYDHGVCLTTAVVRRASPRSQDARLKTGQFVTGVLAHLDGSAGAAPQGEAHEMLLLGPMGGVAEGTVSNLFLIRGKRLLTPSGHSGILKGITRGVAIELALRRGMPAEETILTRHDVYGADECFLTNTSSEILPVVRVDGRRIGSGRPGRMTKGLAADFKRLVRWETTRNGR
jgi:branched-chain amino acid aminotransferase